MNGKEIILTHPAWYPCQPQNLDNHRLHSGTLADLIDNNSCTWNAYLVRTPYPYPICNEILGYPISKTGTGLDSLLWKHSHSGDYYQVKKAYNMLLKEATFPCSVQNRNHDFPQEVWTLIWKVKLPGKIITFVWKVLHDSLPVKLTLKNKGYQRQVLALSRMNPYLIYFSLLSF